MSFDKPKTKNRTKVALIMGGHHVEYAFTMIDGLILLDYFMTRRADKYEILPVKITKEEIWQFPKPLTDSYYELFFKTEHQKNVLQLDSAAALSYIKGLNVDTVFLTPLGDYGENGMLQGWFEIAKIPYTGSGVFASALAVDKVKSAFLFEKEGLRVPLFMHFTKKEWRNDSANIIKRFSDDFNFPIIVKPVDRGSSMGVSIPKTLSELKISVEKALQFSSNIMIQEFIEGTETTCFVLEKESGGIIAFEPWVVAYPKNLGFFGAELKKLRSIIAPDPAQYKSKILSPSLTEIKQSAIRAHKTLGCSGLTRVDMIIDHEKIFVLEINTLPRLHPSWGSLMSKSLLIHGLTFDDLIDIMVDESVNRATKRSW